MAAAKRHFEDSGHTDPDQPNGKRMRSTRPSFASVIGDVVAANCLQNLFSALEPMLRKVVQEEVENGLRRGARSLSRSSSLRIQAPEPSNLQLTFGKILSLPIFTGSKIYDVDGSPLQILLVDKSGGDHMVLTSLPFPIKVEIVVLDGDFPSGDRETWTSDEFNKKIVKERTGKRPLLTGDVNVTMRDGFAPVGDIEFTDNSSWIRSRRFRLGARVVQGSGSNTVRVHEAISEAFVVKDHRGELYKKHYPPALEDEVWRLEKIGKEGKFHKKLSAVGINTVQDFLKLSIVDQTKLRKVLGVGMSEKMWEVTVKHARTCVMGSKMYVSRGPNYTIVLNPICQVVKAVINGQTCHSPELSTITRSFLENFVKDAYQNWESLEEIEGYLSETPLLTQGIEVSQNENIARQYQQLSFSTDGSATTFQVPQGILVHDNSINGSGGDEGQSNGWEMNSDLFYVSNPSPPGVPNQAGHVRSYYTNHNMMMGSDQSSSDDGNLTPATSFIQ